MVLGVVCRELISNCVQSMYDCVICMLLRVYIESLAMQGLCCPVLQACGNHKNYVHVVIWSSSGIL